MLALWLPAGAAQDDVDAAAPERAAIESQKSHINQRLYQAEAACYQRFAVEDCLRAERRKARLERADVREREAVIHAQARHQRADQRAQNIDERLKAHPDSIGPARGALALQPPKPSPQRRSMPAKPGAEQARQQAQRRAATERTAQAAEARNRQIQKREAAQAHRIQVQRAQAERNPPGRPLAAPLPPAS